LWRAHHSTPATDSKWDFQSPNLIPNFGVYFCPRATPRNTAKAVARAGVARGWAPFRVSINDQQTTKLNHIAGNFESSHDTIPDAEKGFKKPHFSQARSGSPCVPAAAGLRSWSPPDPRKTRPQPQPQPQQARADVLVLVPVLPKTALATCWCYSPPPSHPPLLLKQPP